MENGDKRDLENLKIEVKLLRERAHNHATHITTLNTKVGVLEQASGKTGGVLDRLKDIIVGLLAAGLLFMLLKFGIPKL